MFWGNAQQTRLWFVLIQLRCQHVFALAVKTQKLILKWDYIELKFWKLSSTVWILLLLAPFQKSLQILFCDNSGKGFKSGKIQTAELSFENFSSISSRYSRDKITGDLIFGDIISKDIQCLIIELAGSHFNRSYFINGLLQRIKFHWIQTSKSLCWEAGK